jgi:hypothetical protein
MKDGGAIRARPAATSPLIAATTLSLIAAAVALMLAARAGSPSGSPQLWAIAVGTSVLAGGLLLLSTARAVLRGTTGDHSAQLPASEYIQHLPLVLMVVAAAIFAEIVGTAVFGLVVYGDRPGPGVHPGASLLQSFNFAMWVSLFVLPLLTLGLLTVMGIEAIEVRIGLPTLSVRIAGGFAIGAATLVFVASAGSYIALADWAAVPIALIAGVATTWWLPRPARRPELDVTVLAFLKVLPATVVAFLPYALVLATTFLGSRSPQ